MLCPSVFTMAPAHMRPFLDLHWPMRSLWPDGGPLCSHLEELLLLHMQEVRQSLQRMERLMDHSSFMGGFRPISFQHLGEDSGGFALSLDTAHFSPDELSVTQVGRTLRVSGRTEQKQEDGRGSSSHRRQEFRQEFYLPEGVAPNTVTCSLVGGRLQIQAPQDKPKNHGIERIVPIHVSSAPAITSCSPCGGAEENTATPSDSQLNEKN